MPRPDRIDDIAEWNPPNLYADAPVGVTKAMLVKWLRANALFAFTTETAMIGIVRVIESHYGGTIRPSSGDIPAPWDVWAYVQKAEKRLQGGQQSLFPEEDPNG